MDPVGLGVRLARGSAGLRGRETERFASVRRWSRCVANLVRLCQLAGFEVFVFLRWLASNGRVCRRNDTRNGTRRERHDRLARKWTTSEVLRLTRCSQLQALQHVGVLANQQDQRPRLVVPLEPAFAALLKTLSLTILPPNHRLAHHLTGCDKDFGL